MIQREFLIDAVGTSDQPDACFLLGRCGDFSLTVGDRFSGVYRNVEREYPEELEHPAVRVEEYPVSIRIERIQALGLDVSVLSEGITGRLTVSGEGLGRLSPGWVLGQHSVALLTGVGTTA